MTTISSLPELSTALLDTARSATSGRAARTLHGGHEATLRQTLMALSAGNSLGEHDSPGEATLQVLVGRVRLSAGDSHWEAGAGDHLEIPPARHDLAAIEDAVVLLSVVVNTGR